MEYELLQIDLQVFQVFQYPTTIAKDTVHFVQPL